MVGKSRKRHQMRHLGVFYRLFRDQEVEGSNPFAPNTSLKFNNFMLLSLTRPPCVLVAKAAKSETILHMEAGYADFCLRAWKKPERQLYQGKISQRDARATEFLPITAMSEQFGINQVWC